ncbi:hypothetical protein CKO_03747 [Citrobacter koseri ATCC BAA-895]|uniref:Uncharacterized protein n=1 Tax=Citrobacter koseri (strain ATCC BAA-895 / CDC 4225-83 / SGSC4696) TaxID=290338 RepID=A8AMW0_CITK8|nr:hypothetical protein CKO_03747 [Citrobacter koseri ATCC BAA-895]
MCSYLIWHKFSIFEGVTCAFVIFHYCNNCYLYITHNAKRLLFYWQYCLSKE